MFYNAYDLNVASPLPKEQLTVECESYHTAIENLVIDFLKANPIMLEDWDEDLSSIHGKVKYLSKGNLASLHPEKIINKLLTEQFVTSLNFKSIYRALVSHIVRLVVREECVYMRLPTLRCVFPNRHGNFFASQWRDKNNEYVSYHSDILFGDPTGQVQAWLPLTNLRFQSTISLMPVNESIKVLEVFFAEFNIRGKLPSNTRERFFQFVSSNFKILEDINSLSSEVECKPGDILLFDARCLHATTDPLKALRTRVSLDFRIVPVRIYEQRMKDESLPNFMGIELLLGGYYAEDIVYPHESIALDQ